MGNLLQKRIPPAGVHEIPFFYTLPKSLPSLFKREFGHVRYTCRACCERLWDFEIVTQKAFTIVGLEDINSETKDEHNIQL
uniref:Arrestin_N domain-containing protein n=1 Tax=Heterorhabditis bacteriophora TaxID=37862 RepID=A0A1I7XUL2_HETBA